ncbi:hypothetical protein Gotri_021663 [Gossypium trilobum]|uniref:Protein transport protein Sec61 subunit gamma n=2 Tax=Gossypium TaxID=3633 RepID=A0A7J9DDB0_9ROSI|nr:hypothetical protein [Gossypium aridum]MBA0758689.1 hypothetical protein [Gossypium trilobum]
MDAIDSVFDPLREFAKDSVRLVKRCHKPDRKEFTKVAFRTAIGFVVMGFVGFFVKLIFIPINNIIVGSVEKLHCSLNKETLVRTLKDDIVGKGIRVKNARGIEDEQFLESSVLMLLRIKYKKDTNKD